MGAVIFFFLNRDRNAIFPCGFKFMTEKLFLVRKIPRNWLNRHLSLGLAFEILSQTQGARDCKDLSDEYPYEEFAIFHV